MLSWSACLRSAFSGYGYFLCKTDSLLTVHRPLEQQTFKHVQVKKRWIYARTFIFHLIWHKRHSSPISSSNKNGYFCSWFIRSKNIPSSYAISGKLPETSALKTTAKTKCVRYYRQSVITQWKLYHWRLFWLHPRTKRARRHITSTAVVQFRPWFS